MKEGFAYTVDLARRLKFPDLRDVPLHEYEDLLNAAPFVFRVHDELAHVKHTLSNDFIAREYVGESSGNIVDNRLNRELPLNFDAFKVQYAIKAHIRNFFKVRNPDTNCPWISTTPLWTWAIGEAIKRSSTMKDVKVTIIDLRKLLKFDRSLPGNASDRRMVFYGMELLHLTNQTHDAYASEWTNHPQEILVYGVIPASTIVNTISFGLLGVPIAFAPESRLLESPLPPWYFQGFTNKDVVIWEYSRTAEWYSGSEGVRASLLRNFKCWAETRHDGDASGLMDEIASTAFRFAEFLVLRKGQFREAIESARKAARGWEMDAEDDLVERLQRTKLRDRAPSVDGLSASSEVGDSDEFPREQILKNVRELWERVMGMTWIIAIWGLEDLDDTHWDILQTQIMHHARDYALEKDSLELEVKRCEVTYNHHNSQQNTLWLKTSSLRPKILVW
ncbi:hypothetical protein EV368DRAFT_82595 [Lentinula lateritia]|uniref:Uncharacterized protein n=1 Tax=Lentinula aff. lateritia TaxID=2804960 RepID=A0ACC1U9I0_9AGAR|nr:hypothetical protein F5876DRAFT_73634 [Lentinula aff. lateritia]KAJ3852398.1 hypothetical protein EV368DRAFT_82595 [Lentinula lateritia]